MRGTRAKALRKLATRTQQDGITVYPYSYLKTVPSNVLNIPAIKEIING